MTSRHDLTVTLPWMRGGTALLSAVTDGLTDDDLRAPSALPGWTRAHVIGHLARNAEALTRLATWARTGVPTPMYANRGQRAAEIESSATAPPGVLRHQLRSTAAELEDALAALDATTWQAEVKSALGRTVPAAEIPWMRVREVWLHAVDLASATTFTDLPAALVDALLDDVTATLSTRPECPAVRLTPTDRERTWHLGPPTARPPVPSGAPAAELLARAPAAELLARAPAAELLAWTTGRSPGPEPLRLPLPRWL